MACCNFRLLTPLFFEELREGADQHPQGLAANQVLTQQEFPNRNRKLLAAVKIVILFLKIQQQCKTRLL